MHQPSSDDSSSSSSSSGTSGGNSPYPSSPHHHHHHHQQQQQPGLLAFPDLPDAQQQLLCEVLGLSPGDARLLHLTAPAASALDAAQLSESWATLRTLLPVPQPQLLQALLQLPELLGQPGPVIAARLAAGAAALGLPRARVRGRSPARTAELHWRLVVTPKGRLVGQLRQLGALLGGLGRPQVAALVCGEPGLLGLDAPALLSAVEALEQVCGCPLARLLPQLAREPRVLARPAGVLYKAASRLQQLLRLSEEGLALVLRRCPGALLVSSRRLAELLTQLAAHLLVHPDEAVDFLLQEPRVLVRSPGDVSAVLSVLKTTFRLGPEELMQVVQFDPSILCFPPGLLADNTRQFRRLALSCLPWAAEYKHLMSRPANVARALRIEPLRLQRLVFLSDQGLEASISLRAALTLSGRKFVEGYPRYRAWLAARYSAGNAPRRLGPGAYGGDDEEEDDEDDDGVGTEGH